MVDTLLHDGVVQWRFASPAGRVAGFSSSAFVTADGVLVDTGFGAARRDFARLLDSTHVRGVILTHHHEDHAGNVELVAARGLPLWLAPATQALVTEVAPIRAYRRLVWSSTAPLRTSVVPFDPGALSVLSAPGHCADHHVVWDAATRTLFAGDLFLGVAVRIAHHDENLWASIDSLDRIAALEPVRMFCAHRGLVPDAAAALRAKAAWIRQQVAVITAAIMQGATDDAILRTVMGGESLTGWASRGEYSRRNFIRFVRRRPTPAVSA
ncbi:MAG: MBL fold metallo-hydrolase [Gemmatimonadota bacterium]